MKVGDLVQIGEIFGTELGLGVVTSFDSEWARVLWMGTFEWIPTNDLEVISENR